MSVGDIHEAIVDHAVYLAIWRRYQALPERFNWKLKVARRLSTFTCSGCIFTCSGCIWTLTVAVLAQKPDFGVYPLRPELFESTYLLYRATGNRYAGWH